MYILGISCFYHDSSATLMKDGVVVVAAQEERFSRIKHDTSFPIHAIEFCLESQGIAIKDIEYIGFYEKPFLKFERALFQFLEMFPLSYKIFINTIPSWVTEKLRVVRIIKKQLNYKGVVLFVEHHLAHAASSFLLSPYKEAAIVTCDGVGEWTTTSIGFGDLNNITLTKEIRFPNSIGLLYSTITAYLGFSVNNSEYKVMGLSAYGERDPKKNMYYKKLRKVIDLKEDGSFKLDMSYFKFHYSNRMPSKKLCGLLEGDIRKADQPVTKRHEDIAAAVQMVTEEVLLKVINYAYKLTKSENLVMAGGVALNSVLNGKILKRTKFKKLWINPDPGDGGTSMGVAAYIYFTLLKHKRFKHLSNPYLGPEFSEKEIKNFIKAYQIKSKYYRDEKVLVKEVARLIYDSNVIGWFEKGMEWGPRALGARSILSNPCNPKMQEILNTKVKHREKFRPFAPVVCRDDAELFFEIDKPLPEISDYMLMVYPIKRKWHKVIPAVTHIDGSGRLQTISKSQNVMYYQLIKEFGKLTGVPILINTSFNIRGEPIVCTPLDAYKCMMGTGIDYLVLGDYLIKREDNLKDAWDSEKYAHD